MKQKIEQLITLQPKHACKMIFGNNTKYAAMKSWIESNCHPSAITNPEKVYSALNNGYDCTCPCGSGKNKRLISMILGFGVGCGAPSKCSYSRQMTSINVTKACADRTPEEIEAAKLKRASTNLVTYGHENIGQSEFAKAAHKALYTDKNKVAEITKGMKDTCLERHGFENPQQNPEIKAKTIATLQTLYNVSNVNQIHIDPVSMSTLSDKEALANILRVKSISETSEMLSVCRQTIIKYHNDHGLDIIDLSKSQFEVEMEMFLNEYGINCYVNNRKVIDKELDFYIPDHNLAIECHGLYWHSESMGKDKSYHKNKTDQCQALGIQLLSIFHDEWINNSKIIKAHILHLCGKSSKVIGARKCSIQKIDHKQATSFIERHHIQGSTTNININYGAFYQNDLVAVFSLKDGVDGESNITRYTIDQKASYTGLFSKFIKYIQNDRPAVKTLTTFADRRWSVGKIYKSSGFTEEYQVGPDYFYTNYKERWHKSNFMKTKISKKFNVDATNKTEKQLMEELGFDRIWDCGKIKFRLDL
jgi:virulence-associated protein VapD